MLARRGERRREETFREAILLVLLDDFEGQGRDR